jgi:hypothetical protein
MSSLLHLGNIRFSSEPGHVEEEGEMPVRLSQENLPSAESMQPQGLHMENSEQSAAIIGQRTEKQGGSIQEESSQRGKPTSVAKNEQAKQGKSFVGNMSTADELRAAADQLEVAREALEAAQRRAAAVQKKADVAEEGFDVHEVDKTSTKEASQEAPTDKADADAAQPVHTAFTRGSKIKQQRTPLAHHSKHAPANKLPKVIHQHHHEMSRDAQVDSTDQEHVPHSSDDSDTRTSALGPTRNALAAGTVKGKHSSSEDKQKQVESKVRETIPSKSRSRHGKKKTRKSNAPRVEKVSEHSEGVHQADAEAERVASRPQDDGAGSNEVDKIVAAPKFVADNEVMSDEEKGRIARMVLQSSRALQRAKAKTTDSIGQAIKAQSVVGTKASTSHDKLSQSGAARGLARDIRNVSLPWPRPSTSGSLPAAPPGKGPIEMEPWQGKTTQRPYDPLDPDPYLRGPSDLQISVGEATATAPLQAASSVATTPKTVPVSVALDSAVDEGTGQYGMHYPPKNRPQLEQYLRISREMERVELMGGISQQGARDAFKNLYANWTHTDYNVKERYLSGMRVRIIGEQIFYSPEPPELRHLAVTQPVVFEHMFSIVAAHVLSFLSGTMAMFKLPNVDFTVAFGDFCVGTTRLFHDAWGSKKTPRCERC